MRILILVLLGAMGAVGWWWYTNAQTRAEPAPSDTSASISQLVDAIYLQAETQRLREALGDASIGQRMAQNRAAVALWEVDVGFATLRQLRQQRDQLAARYLARVDAAVKAPSWPPGDPAQHAARARLLLDAARSGYAQARAADQSATAALEFAAAALALAEGDPDRLPQFLGITGDVGDVTRELALPEGQAPRRTDRRIPPTALTIPMGN